MSSWPTTCRCTSQNGWLADLTDLVDRRSPTGATSRHRPEGWLHLLRQGLGLPAAQFVMGYFVNKDLFEAANLDAPEYGVSVDDFFDAATELTNVPQGILGLDEEEFDHGLVPQHPGQQPEVVQLRWRAA